MTYRRGGGNTGLPVSHVPAPQYGTTTATLGADADLGSSASSLTCVSQSANSMGAAMDMVGTLNKATEEDYLHSVANLVKKAWHLFKFPSFNKSGSQSEKMFLKYIAERIRIQNPKVLAALEPKIKKKATDVLRHRRSAVTLEMKENFFGRFGTNILVHSLIYLCLPRFFLISHLGCPGR